MAHWGGHPCQISQAKAIKRKQHSVALIKSISGIRGTIGGNSGNNLTPVDITKFTAAFASIIAGNTKEDISGKKTKIVIGRDGRISGPMVRDLVVSTLTGMGIDVIDLGLSTTPTMEIAVKEEKADGGIIITASHNPKEWNALKLLNNEGEFISAEIGEKVLEKAAKEDFVFNTVEQLGELSIDDSYMQKHIDAILNYPLVNKNAIASQQYKIIVDGINSTGATFVPALLKALGVKNVIVLNEEVNGNFAHNPEPLPQHLSELSREVVKQKAHLGIAVDPDVDRLCFVCEDGSMFGEEYTLVAIADYVLSKRKGNTVSNMSSTRALKDITEKHEGEYFPSAVGEVNVVRKMKEVNAVIGIGLFLSHLANHMFGAKSLRGLYPDYFISKNKIELNNGVDVKSIFEKIKKKYKKHPINTEDGLKIEFDNDWVHLRTSNTEPIIRIYAESDFETKANHIATRIMQDIGEFM